MQSTTKLLHDSSETHRAVFICHSCLRTSAVRRNVRRSFFNSAIAREEHIAPPELGATVPFRKLLKDELKRQKLRGESKKSKHAPANRLLEKWELTVGIEIHVELNTAKKLFSTAATSTNQPPNTHVAHFDAAIPGTQPQFQKETLIPALRAALALNCTIHRKSAFDRKHYFYQDQPAGYQITQYYEPFATSGSVVLYPHDGIAELDHPSITIPIKQVQMEQDTAKTLHQPPSTHLLDFNRVSHPLVEIITEPVIHHPATAAACVRKIQSLLRAVDACTLGMELGGLRADVNVSVRPRPQLGQEIALGQRTEIKNLSSFKAVEGAIIAERDRQIEVLEAGGSIDGETRGWTLGGTQTTMLRGKEGEVDYRYMPDPDIPPLLIGNDLLHHLQMTMLNLPDDLVMSKLASTPYGLSVLDAIVLVATEDGDRLEYYMELVTQLQGLLSAEEFTKARAGKLAGNWVLHELGSLLATSDISWHDQPVKETHLASILVRLIRREITSKTSKQLLAMIFNGDPRPVEKIIEDENLSLRPMSKEEYLSLAQNLIAENGDMVRAITEKNQKGKIMWFVGQMMRQGEEGRMEADKAKKVLEELMEL
ncbi:Glutamyl-tRNA amidotransferase subunit B, mitochondrial [Viridothelium virens]|uniref:Glutamyl-tRNA(Gln) amidotransferase subunit B, mitochondrial n=1 Tax=Viridothelium virens TaxID=1048519 RepID=A0A6A6H7H0_VIRVR|nr:Glutamyl-tRNA amidotransferase subunit B, mitochondrial [Viridothelium virens]